MRPLSARQLEVLEAIRDFAQDTGRMPSVRELSKVVGRSPSTVQQHLEALTHKGWLDRDGSAHGLRLADRSLPDVGTVAVPVVGTIAAGAPIEALEVPLEPLALPVTLAPAGAFALVVRGDSMIDDHILEGDLVIVRPQASVENGEIAVALLEDGSATLKRIFREDGYIRLQPANDALQPLWVSRVRVQGKVVGVIRRLGRTG